MADMRIRTGHTRPIDFTLKRDGSAVDVSSAGTKVARGRIKGKSTTKFSNNLSFVTDGTDGKVRMTPGSSDFDTANIMYEVEVRVVLADGTEFVPKLFTIWAEEALPAP